MIAFWVMTAVLWAAPAHGPVPVPPLATGSAFSDTLAVEFTVTPVGERGTDVPAAGRGTLAYDNLCDPCQPLATDVCGSWIGDLMILERPGVLQRMTFSVCNSHSSPSTLMSSSLYLYFCNFDPTTGSFDCKPLVLVGTSQQLNLAPNECVYLTSNNVAGAGIELDQQVLVMLHIGNCWWEGAAGFVEQCVCHPPTVGSSQDFYYNGAGWANFGGNPVANLAYEVSVVPADWGACCLPSEDCQQTTEQACRGQGGLWLVGEACTADLCTGACCMVGGGCIEDTTYSECAAWLPLSQSWGLNGTCDECPPVPESRYFFGLQTWLGSDGDPVNTATGNFYHQETDLALASRLQPLLFERYYNSLDNSVGPLGPGWMHTYNIVLDDSYGTDEVAVRWADGQVVVWHDAGGGTYEATQWDNYEQLTADGNGWYVTTQAMDVFAFDTSGRLLSIVDKNGNAVTLSYGDPGHPDAVTSVADCITGHALSLDYDDGLLSRVSDWTGRHVDYSYDGQGRLTQVLDVAQDPAHPILYRYTGNDQLDQITDQRGVTVVTNEYDAQGRVWKQWDGNGHLTEFTYGGRADNETVITRTVEGVALDTIHAHDPEFKKQLAVENPRGEVIDYGYWDFERTAIVDRNGNETRFVYDDRGNVVKAIEADDARDRNDGGETVVEYGDPDCPHVPTSKTDALSFVTEWEYDDHCNVVLERRYLDLERTEYLEKSWTYNSFGQRTRETNERGHQHEWVYDADGLLTREIDWDLSDPQNPVQVSNIWYGYDALWRRTWATDGRGTGAGDPAHTTNYYYDPADRLVRIEGPPVNDPPERITQWMGYDEVGNQRWVTDGNGSAAQDPLHTTWYEYDGNSNLLRVTDALGGVTAYEYDELNRRTKMANPNGNLQTQYTRYGYDEADRLVEQEDPEHNLWTYEYDAQGNLVHGTDAAGVQLWHDYDALNRRVRTVDELNHETLFTYDQLSRLVRQVDANGNTTDLTYDALGRLACVVDAEGGWTEYRYDAAGNLLEIEDARDQVVSRREYDALDRLVYAEDGNGNAFFYGYDAVGNQTTITDGNNQTTQLTYDAENRLTYIDYPDGTYVAYTYDGNGNQGSITDWGTGAPATTTFTYDELNRLVSSTDAYGRTVLYDYDAAGNRRHVTYPADSINPARVVEYTYDTANRLTAVTDWANRQTLYGYEGRRLKTTTFPNGLVESRGYDGAGRLESLVTTEYGGGVLLGYAWSRDPIGSPTSASETGTLEPTVDQLATGYEYDADNRLLSSTQGTYQHDANGNLTARTVDGVTTTFGYDFEDRLVEQTTDGMTVQHVYDGQSHRIARIAEDGRSIEEVRYVLDRGRAMSHVLCETDANGDILAYYIHGLRLVARIAVAVGGGETPRYYHTNDIGSVVALTDDAQLITDRYAYEPFGLPVGHEGATEQPFTYVGSLGVMAEADGLYFMRARFYDPDTGRFLGKDPIQGAMTAPRELHRYVYGLNDPVLATDPSGEYALLDDVIAAGVGAAGGALGTVVGDLIGMATGQQEGFSSWETYAANTAGGALGAWSSLYLGPGGLAVGAAVSSGMRQVLEKEVSGTRAEYDLQEFGMETLVGTATSWIGGKAAGKILGKLRVPKASFAKVSFYDPAVKGYVGQKTMLSFVSRSSGRLTGMVGLKGEGLPQWLASYIGESFLSDAVGSFVDETGGALTSEMVEYLSTCSVEVRTARVKLR